MFGKKENPAVEAQPEVKKEEPDDGVKAEVEDEADTKTLKDIPTAEEAAAKAAEVVVKKEEGNATAAPAIVFKKRKKAK